MLLCFWLFIFKIFLHILFQIISILYSWNNFFLCFNSWSSIYLVIEVRMRVYCILLIEIDFIFICRWNWGYLINIIRIFGVIFDQRKIISFFVLTNMLDFIKRVLLYIYILILLLYIIAILFTFFARILIKIIVVILFSLISWLNLSLLQLNFEIFWLVSFWEILDFSISLCITIFNEA